VATSSTPPSPWHTIGRLCTALLAFAVLTAGLLLPYIGGLGLAAGHEADKFLDTTCSLTETQPPQRTTLYASDGRTVLATLFSQNRVPVPVTDMPGYLQQALVATEDRRFYSHHGVDMRGLIRSAISTSGGNTQGGSTLTMQYVKQIRYYQAGQDIKAQEAAIAQNLTRKIEDAKCAIYIESVKHESKQTILQNYLNIAFFGENAYGIQIAARTYFDVDAKALTLPQAALLVGLLRAPTEYDPFVNPQAALQRRNVVLQNLVDVGDLSQASADAYGRTPVKLATTSPPPVYEGCANSKSAVPNVGFFCDYVVNWLEQKQGISDTDLKTGGYSIVTTLNAGVQTTTQVHLSQRMPATSQMTAVLPVVDPKTGDVLAMAASKYYGINASTKDNTHTEQPIFTAYVANGASTYKLFPLLTALSTGVPTSWSLQTVGNIGTYTPHNCATSEPAQNGDSNETYGTAESLTTATVKSSNTFFVGLADQLFGCDLAPIINMAEKLGMSALTRPSGEGNFTVAQTILNNQRVKELVLGSIPTSPLELTGAYAAIANQGVYNAPAPVRSITAADGTPIAIKRTPGTQVVTPQVAVQATQILTGDTRGSGTSASEMAQFWYPVNSSRVAGKTGTMTAGTNGDQSGAIWFVGITPTLVATSAVINFDSPGAPAVGLPGLANPAVDAYGGYAAGLWASALAPVLADARWSWPDPTSVPGVPVPRVIGLDLASAKAMLASRGFRMAELDSANHLECASSVPLGRIAYAGPTIAPPGSTIVVCPSNGVSVAVGPAPSRTTSGGGGGGGGGNNPPSTPRGGGGSHTRTHGPPPR
jgi:membrane peptidoglycan carboxypeptidase